MQGFVLSVEFLHHLFEIKVLLCTRPPGPTNVNFWPRIRIPKSILKVQSGPHVFLHCRGDQIVIKLGITHDIWPRGSDLRTLVLKSSKGRKTARMPPFLIFLKTHLFSNIFKGAGSKGRKRRGGFYGAIGIQLRFGSPIPPAR